MKALHKEVIEQLNAEIEHPARAAKAVSSRAAVQAFWDNVDATFLTVSPEDPQWNEQWSARERFLKGE